MIEQTHKYKLFLSFSFVKYKKKTDPICRGGSMMFHTILKAEDLKRPLSILGEETKLQPLKYVLQNANFAHI